MTTRSINSAKIVVDTFNHNASQKTSEYDANKKDQQSVNELSSKCQRAVISNNNHAQSAKDQQIVGELSNAESIPMRTVDKQIGVSMQMGDWTRPLSKAIQYPGLWH